MMTVYFISMLACTGGPAAGETDDASDTDAEPQVCPKYADKAVFEQPFIDAVCPWTGECPEKYGEYENCLETYHTVFSLDSLTYDACDAEACLEALGAAQSCEAQDFPEPCQGLLDF